MRQASSPSVVPGGLEPPLTEPKTVVLPLHHRTIPAAKVMLFVPIAKFPQWKFANDALMNQVFLLKSN